MKRWERESREFLENLSGHLDSVNDDNKENELSILQKKFELERRRNKSGGRPRAETHQDPLVPYNFRVRKSLLDRVRAVADTNFKLISELMNEAIEDVLTKYENKEKGRV